MALTITFEDHDYAFDKDAITIDEWRELKRKYKMTPKQFDDTIGQADPDSSTFMYWVMLRQNGNQGTPLGDALKPDIIKLNNALAAALTAVPDPEPDEPDPPTGAAGSPPATTPSDGSAPETSTGSAASTSSSSPATADSEPPM